MCGFTTRKKTMEHEPHYVIHDMREVMADRESVSHLPEVGFHLQLPDPHKPVTAQEAWAWLRKYIS